ncbi:MAG: hypothetical protein RIQ33_976, partial [Bacteroidota bacterium]
MFFELKLIWVEYDILYYLFLYKQFNRFANNIFKLKSLQHELQNIFSGKSQIGSGSIIQSIFLQLTGSQRASASVEKSQSIKEQEAKQIIEYCDRNQFWFNSVIDEQLKIGEGAEQQVFYLDIDKTVLKLNDGIFYSSWSDYLKSLLLHNFFFPDTTYHLQGFQFLDEKLVAVVTQKFIVSNEVYDFEIIKRFLEFNGFENNRNYDFIHPKLGIILEDLHD